MIWRFVSSCQLIFLLYHQAHLKIASICSHCSLYIMVCLEIDNAQYTRIVNSEWYWRKINPLGNLKRIFFTIKKNWCQFLFFEMTESINFEIILEMVYRRLQLWTRQIMQSIWQHYKHFVTFRCVFSETFFRATTFVGAKYNLLKKQNWWQLSLKHKRKKIAR